MSIIHEPLLQHAAIKELHPTQITIGMREVRQTLERWRGKRRKKTAKNLDKHLVPVILGPNDRHYIVGHHHLARALYDEGVKHVLVTVLENLSGLSPEAFWSVLDNRSWTHPYDEKGRRQTYDAIPRSVRDLIDDPFRSLANELHRVGGFAKQTTPFSEFLWADFSEDKSHASWLKTTSHELWKKRSNSQRGRRKLFARLVWSGHRGVTRKQTPVALARERFRVQYQLRSK